MKKSLADIEIDTATEASKPAGFGAFSSVENGEARVDLTKLREMSVFFATPCYGGLLTDQYFLSMFKATQELMRAGINFKITTLRNESLISRARNILTAMFMQSDCTHLLFVDADIEFQPDAIIRALAYDKDIIAGAYPKKTLPIQYAINLKIYDKESRRVRTDKGAVEVLDASTGFFLVKRETVEKMMAAHPELHYKSDSNTDPIYNEYMYALFDTMIDPRDSRYLSEDYTFCRRWQNLGGEIWVDTNTKLNHVGSYTFEGDVSKLLTG